MTVKSLQSKIDDVFIKTAITVKDSIDRRRAGYPFRTLLFTPKQSLEFIYHLALSKLNNTKELTDTAFIPCGASCIEPSEDTCNTAVMGCNAYARVVWQDTARELPKIKTVTGDQLVEVTTLGTTIYRIDAPEFKCFRIEVFVNQFNRFLETSEYRYNGGKIYILTGGPYDSTYTFKIIPGGTL